MLSSSVRAVFFSVVLLFFQSFVLSALQPIHQFINVYVYFLPILFIPVRASVYVVVSISCLLGFFVDISYDSMGLFLTASLWVGYLRNKLLLYFVPSRRLKMVGEEPITLNLLSTPMMLLYIAILCGIHNAVVILLEWFSAGINYYILLKWILDTLYSTAMTFLVYLFYAKVIVRK